MKISLPKLSCFLAMALGCLSQPAAGQPVSTPRTAARPSDLPPAARQPPPANDQFLLPEQATPAPTARTQPLDSGELLLARAREAMDRHPSISAQVRYRVEMFGQSPQGGGRYLQQGAGEQRQLRLELRVANDNEVTTLQQLNDGKFLWQYHELAEEQTLTRIDLRRVRQALEELDAPARAKLLLPQADTAQLAAGGLPQLLAGVQKSFRVGSVEARRLDTLPVWEVTGTWRPEALARINKELVAQARAGQPLDLKKLPPQLPEEISIYLGQSDLFPYRVEYRRRPGNDGRAGEGEPPQTTLLVELYDVRLGTAIDPAQFSYNPGRLEILDTTDSHLRRLGVKE